jgi:hypothetical protein
VRGSGFQPGERIAFDAGSQELIETTTADETGAFDGFQITIPDFFSIFTEHSTIEITATGMSSTNRDSAIFTFLPP